MLRRTWGWVVLAMVGVAGGARADFRHECDCVSRLAGDLKRHADDLGREIRHSPLRSSPRYFTLYGLTQQLGSQADCLAGMARHGASYHALRRDMDKITCTFRELGHELRNIGGCTPPPFHHTSGRPDFAAPQSFRRSQSNGLDRLMDCTSQKIDELAAAVGNLRDHREPPLPPPGPPGRPGYPGHPGHPATDRMPPPGRPGVGLTFNNGRVTFSFGR